jgi:hypothetical protein
VVNANKIRELDEREKTIIKRSHTIGFNEGIVSMIQLMKSVSEELKEKRGSEITLAEAAVLFERTWENRQNRLKRS